MFLLDNKSPYFPDPLDYPDENTMAYFEGDSGLYAIGGDLSPVRLLNAYHLGIFPWTPKTERKFLWFCPRRRFVIFPEKIHVSHSMRSLIRKRQYTVTIDRDFAGVIHHCSQLRIQDEGAWLDSRMEDAYLRLHQMGWAHSVEVWKDDEIVGGLYGLQVNGVFCGESMFSLVPSASKLALIALAQFLEKQGGKLIDCQFHTPHLESMGGEYISYEEFRKILDRE